MEGMAAQEPTPLRPARKMTEDEKIADARERVAKAVAELDTAVRTAERFDVPGWDLGVYLATKMEPVLARVSLQIKPIRKTRGAKA